MDTSEDEVTHLTLLGMQLKNRGSVDEGNNVVGTFEGKIKDIKEFVVLLPKGVAIPNDGADCKPVKFKKYDLVDCRSSCTIVETECNDECGEIYSTETNDAAKTAKTNDCNKKKCTPLKNECINDCNILFSSDGKPGADGQFTTDYTGYQIDINDLNEKSKDNNNYYSDIDKYRTFACQIEPDETVLGDSSITTRYIRTRVKYDYLHQKSVNVDVEGGAFEGNTGSLITIGGTGQLPPALGLAVAWQESGFKHCLVEVNPCPPDKILTSSAEAKGIMQIAERSHKDRIKRVCGESTIYDYDCNLAVGVDFLEGLYETYKDGIPQRLVEKYCHNKEMQKKYLSYKGWYAVLRGYNGLGCSPSTADLDYPEKIIKNACEIENGNSKIAENEKAPRLFTNALATRQNTLDCTTVI